MESLIAHETGCAVYKNKLKATDTEPWDQYVFDITSQEEEQDYEDNMSDAEADADSAPGMMRFYTTDNAGTASIGTDLKIYFTCNLFYLPKKLTELKGKLSHVVKGYLLFVSSYL